MRKWLKIILGLAAEPEDRIMKPVIAPLRLRPGLPCRGTGSHWKTTWRAVSAVVLGMLATAPIGRGADDPAGPLPLGGMAVGDAGQACRGSTPTRERIWRNGLMRGQPAAASPAQVTPATIGCV